MGDDTKRFGEMVQIKNIMVGKDLCNKNKRITKTFFLFQMLPINVQEKTLKEWQKQITSYEMAKTKNQLLRKPTRGSLSIPAQNCLLRYISTYVDTLHKKCHCQGLAYFNFSLV